MGAGHAHGAHDHDSVGWDAWRGTPQLPIIAAALGLIAVVTIIGLIAMWPDPSRSEGLSQRVEDAGLPTERFAAEVTGVSERPCNFEPPANPDLVCRSVEVIPEAGPDAGIITVYDFILDGSRVAPTASVGDRIILGRVEGSGFTFFVDEDRRGTLLILAALFAAVVVAFARTRGVLALVSLAITFVVLTGFVAPSVLSGNDPVLVSVIAAVLIGFVTLYLTHGFTPITTIALFGMFAALALTWLISTGFFALARFSGLTTEGGAVIPVIAADIDLSALLLGGVIIGTLGALDDVTITQVATVSELHAAQPNLSRTRLFNAGVRIGRSHVASAVNTLVLAYAGAAMPLLLIFDATGQSADLAANSEAIAVEIVRTLCGSIGLIAAVPLTTFLAASLVATHDGSDEGPDTDPTPTWNDFAPRDD